MAPTSVGASATGNGNEDDMVSNGGGERRGGVLGGNSTSCQLDFTGNLDPVRSNIAPGLDQDEEEDQTAGLVEGSSDLFTTIDPSYVVHLIRQLLPPMSGPSDPYSSEVSSHQSQPHQGEGGIMKTRNRTSASACEEQDVRLMQGNVGNRAGLCDHVQGAVADVCTAQRGVESPVNEDGGGMCSQEGMGSDSADDSSLSCPSLREGREREVLRNPDGPSDGLEVGNRGMDGREGEDERGGRRGGPNVNAVGLGMLEMGNCRMREEDKGLEMGRLSAQQDAPVGSDELGKEPSDQTMSAVKRVESDAEVARDLESDGTGQQGMKGMDIGEECGGMEPEELGSKGYKDDGFRGFKGRQDDLGNEEEGEEVEKEDEEREEQDPREEAGCILWDLASNKTHAEFLVQNHLLEVVLAILRSSHTDRMREICLGILANLACHPETERAMTNMEGLVDVAVQQIFVDDPASLTEVCRLLSASLHGDAAVRWGFAIGSDLILGRILWIASNTMQPQLLEKSCELLLAMVDGKSGVGAILIPALLQLSLSDVLIDLLGSELSAITDGCDVHGDTVLDTLLQVAEVLSLHDDCAAQLAANQKVFSLATQVLQLPGREEPGPSAITAVVLIANLLAEEPLLVSVLASDPSFIERLLPILPVVTDDPGARNALWSVLGRIFKTLVSPEWPSDHEFAERITAVIVEGSRMLVQDLEDDHHTEPGQPNGPGADAPHANGVDVADYLLGGNTIGLEWKIRTIADMIQVMERWLAGLGDVLAAGQTASNCLSVNKVVMVCKELQRSMAAVDKVMASLVLKLNSQGQQPQITGSSARARFGC
ncbi:hypothetical protein CBR_g54933 [Chara braunii]|uniref:Uncharacterized protein n=1 Tax=Chara braunii TaxID=69332 RepID=A0A388K7C2_CHABU|nr:hypothetical protein CBR_g54933 [Chara braunii]|eukprot:GBG65954.1 hypothetical protein CBR_g54933 [Chara braunii]